MTTKKTRREFTDEFKREAVVLLRDSGRPLTQVASELGLEPSVLRRWRSIANRAGQVTSAVRPGAAAVAASAEQVEIRRLQKELERAQMERDILKKAVGIFSSPPR
jgi:transposase